LVYSKNRVPIRIIDKIESVLSRNAIGLDNEKTLTIGNNSDFANLGISIPFQKGLYKTISSLKTDVIICEGFFQWTPYAVLSAFIKRIPLWIAYERTVHTERNCPKWRTTYRKIIDYFITGYLVNGILTEEYLLQLGVKNKKILKGCMSADSESLAKKVQELSVIDKQNHKEKLQINSGLTYLFVGKVTERKGIVELLAAWEIHIQNYSGDNLLIIGTGNLENDLIKQYKHLGSLHFLGAIDYELIHNYYCIADVFILPTLEDNWSLVIPEAMACGLPVATSIYNGCHPELVIPDINGITFDPLKQEELLYTLDYFHIHEKKLVEFGNNSRIIQSEYTPQKVAKRIFDVLIEDSSYTKPIE
jgi:glycosyltransferase involved in cell wall biosynthesis